jgi:predicted secreted protein
MILLQKIIFSLIILVIFINANSIKADDGNVFKIPDNVTTFKISTKLGKMFKINLKGNPTTGYEWSLQNFAIVNTFKIVSATNLNERHSAEYVRPASNAYGAGGSYDFKFKALKKTKGFQLIFVYKRSWESTPIKKLTVNVTIN